MIAMVIGTTAELIKMAPVYHELKSLNLKPEIWWTGMHNQEIELSFREFDVDSPTVSLGGKPGRDVESTFQAIQWFLQVAFNGIRKRSSLKKQLNKAGKPVVLVHGDTFTTLIGSALGRFWGATVMHVEAGYRSGSMRSPLPEEFNRVIAAKFTNVHFAPGERQAKNLTNESGTIVDTKFNTGIDALRLISSSSTAAEFDEKRPFGIVTLHRYEFLSDEQLVIRTIEQLKKSSKLLPLYYFAGTHDKHILSELGLLDEIPDTLIFRDKLEYKKFIPIVKKSDLIITDSGGLSLEANLLGIPALIHRLRTENEDGIGKTSLLTKLDTTTFDDFILKRESYRGPNLVDTYFPSMQIAEFVHGYVLETSL